MIQSQRRIGLTGGIATGKTTVSNYLADRHHLTILDADQYAREAVSVGSPILKQLCDRYGQDIVQANGELNRQQLGNIVFPDAAERRWLEAQIHPYVGDRFTAALQDHASEPTIVLAIPLLFEANLTDRVTEIWVVFCRLEQQQQRLMQRNHLTVEQAQARIQTQIPLRDKCDRADVVLDNSGTLETLYRQIDQAL